MQRPAGLRARWVDLRVRGGDDSDAQHTTLPQGRSPRARRRRIRGEWMWWLDGSISACAEETGGVQ